MWSNQFGWKKNKKWHGHECCEIIECKKGSFEKHVFGKKVKILPHGVVLKSNLPSLFLATESQKKYIEGKKVVFSL